MQSDPLTRGDTIFVTEEVPLLKRYCIRVAWLAFGALFVLTLVHIIPGPLFGWLNKPFQLLGSVLQFMLAGEIGGTSSPVMQFDSPDSLYQLGSIAVLSLMGGILWTKLDKRFSYEALRGSLRTCLRLELCLVMIIYGMVKVIPSQFGDLHLGTLSRPVGNLEPYQLMWTFMAYSKPYTIFAGSVELVAAGLIFFRRTSTFGALLTLAIMTNVLAMDFLYGVPVRIWATEILVMAVALVGLDVRRILPLVFTPTAELAQESRLTRPMQIVALVFVLLAVIFGGRTSLQNLADDRQGYLLNGSFKVLEFDGPGLAPWKSIVAWQGGACVDLGKGEKVDLGVSFGPGKSFAFKQAETGVPFQFTYEGNWKESVILSGTFKGQPCKMRLERTQPSYPLLKFRGVQSSFR